MVNGQLICAYYIGKRKFHFLVCKCSKFGSNGRFLLIFRHHDDLLVTRETIDETIGFFTSYPF